MAPVLLIFGTSHVGKSTLADRVATLTGWEVRSTDSMGRHPGRPWPEVRAPVAEFFTRLSDETIYWLLRAHHENMWRHLRPTISQALEHGRGAVFEGSALRPEFIAELQHPKLALVGLHADAMFLEDRMRSESAYLQQDSTRQLLIDKFIARSLRDNAENVDTSRRLGLPLVDVSDPQNLDQFIAQLQLDNPARP